MSDLNLPVTERDHIAGNPEPTVTLVEYGDFECPHCRHAHTILKKVLASQGDRIRFVFRSFPLTEIHPNAQHASVAAEFAADQGMYWEMHDRLFAGQDHLTIPDLVRYAQELGLSGDGLRDAIEDEELIARVKQDFASGVRSGVKGTPTFFLDGARYDGSWEYEPLTAALNAAWDR